MTVSLLLMMAAAILAAVVLYTFIGFIPGTDETGVLAPVTLAIILAGAPPHVVLAFFISAEHHRTWCSPSSSPPWSRSTS